MSLEQAMQSQKPNNQQLSIGCALFHMKNTKVDVNETPTPIRRSAISIHTSYHQLTHTCPKVLVGPVEAMMSQIIPKNFTRKSNRQIGQFTSTTMVSNTVLAQGRKEARKVQAAVLIQHFLHQSMATMKEAKVQAAVLIQHFGRKVLVILRKQKEDKKDRAGTRTVQSHKEPVSLQLSQGSFDEINVFEVELRAAHREYLRKRVRAVTNRMARLDQKLYDIDARQEARQRNASAVKIQRAFRVMNLKCCQSKCTNAVRDTIETVSHPQSDYLFLPMWQLSCRVFKFKQGNPLSPLSVAPPTYL